MDVETPTCWGSVHCPASISFFLRSELVGFWRSTGEFVVMLPLRGYSPRQCFCQR